MKPLIFVAACAALVLGACAKTVSSEAGAAPAAALAPTVAESPAIPVEPADAPAAGGGPVASIPAAPTEHYVCGGAKLAVKLLGVTAEVAIDSEAPVSLPVLGDAGDTYTNGRLTLFVKQGKVSFARGRMAAQECVAAS